jgi:hypothetical protein
MGLFDKIFKQSKPYVDDSKMIIDSSKNFKKVILDDLKDYLKLLGYKRSNTTFTLDTNELIYYIQVQSSQSSTSKVAKVTVNLGILSKHLLINSGLQPDIGHCQWRFRLGNFLDKPTDKWWIIDSLNTAKSASKEIIGLIENKVLKEWKVIKSTNDLREIWITGRCTGITDKARLIYLNELEK